MKGELNFRKSTQKNKNDIGERKQNDDNLDLEEPKEDVEKMNEEPQFASENQELDPDEVKLIPENKNSKKAIKRTCKGKIEAGKVQQLKKKKKDGN